MKRAPEFDVDDPHARTREHHEPRCPIEQLRRACSGRNDPAAIAIRRFLKVRDRAIAKGDVSPHECIDAAAARGKSRPNPPAGTRLVTTPASYKSEHPRAAEVPM